MKNDIEVLDKLTSIFGPSGYEKLVQAYYMELMKPYVSKVYSDSLGNCYADIDGDPRLPKIMINSHADSIGFMVKYIDDRGFIFTDNIAGHNVVDYRMLPGTFVTILSRRTGKKIKGQFIPTIPVHKLCDEEMMESVDRHAIAIDIGATSEIQAKNNVDIGDYVVIDSPLRITDVGKKIVSANLDDRIGLFCLYRIARALHKSRAKNRCPITLVSTVAEENFLGAAGVAAHNAKPDIALAVDVTIATDTIIHDADFEIAKRYGDIRLDRGLTLSRGMATDDDLFIFLEKICKGRKKNEYNILYQLEIDDAGGEHVQVHTAGKGVKTAFVAVPARNVHTGIETISMKDVEYVIELCTEFYKRVSRGSFK